MSRAPVRSHTTMVAWVASSSGAGWVPGCGSAAWTRAPGLLDANKTMADWLPPAPGPSAGTDRDLCLCPVGAGGATLKSGGKDDDERLSGDSSLR